MIVIAELDAMKMPKLRARLAVWNSYIGHTIFAKHTTLGHCELWIQKGRIRDRLTGPMKVEMARAIVEWEIAKAEGTLRTATWMAA